MSHTPTPRSASLPSPPPPLPSSSSWKEALKIWVPVLLLAGGLFAVAWMFVEPAPPSRVRMATGSAGGAYERMGQRFAAAFGEQGILLETVGSAGSSENVAQLMAGEVDAALVQAGTTPAGAGATIEAVVAIAYEPLLVFVRGELEDVTKKEDAGGDISGASGGASSGGGVGGSLEVLAGKRVAIGGVGSGTRTLVEALLEQVGLAARVAETGTVLLDVGGAKAAEALIAGEIDAACFVMSPEAPVVKRLLGACGGAAVCEAGSEWISAIFSAPPRLTLYPCVFPPIRVFVRSSVVLQSSWGRPTNSSGLDCPAWAPPPLNASCGATTV